MPRAARAVAVVFAALAIGTSIGSLYRAEILVNRPIRALFAKSVPGTAIIVHHSGWTEPKSSVVELGYPGLMSIFANGLLNPLRSADLTEKALRI